MPSAVIDRRYNLQENFAIDTVIRDERPSFR
jgi:hypothetical protein